MAGDREIAEPAQRLQGCAVATAGAQFEGLSIAAATRKQSAPTSTLGRPFCTEHAGEVCGELSKEVAGCPVRRSTSSVVQSLYPALCAAAYSFSASAIHDPMPLACIASLAASRGMLT